MLTRREVEELSGTKWTDDQWKEFQRQFAEVEERMWEEDHPQDE